MYGFLLNIEISLFKEFPTLVSIAALALESGQVFRGRSFGCEDTQTSCVTGEAVFNTSMSGYQEILTDPSYLGQIIVMTYPEIGNYGINTLHNESRKVFCSGFVVKSYNAFPSNCASQGTLQAFLREQNVPALEGIDTRRLTRILRVTGAKKACLAVGKEAEKSDAELIKTASEAAGIENTNLVEKASVAKPYLWEASQANKGPLIAVLDFGVKHNILRCFTSYGARLKIFPATWPAEKILQEGPDGIFLSNGPGDPSAVPHIVAEVKKLLGKKPIFGICFGHQILCQAYDLKTYKLKFGHRGGNQPVKNLESGRIEITAQNHGFAVKDQPNPHVDFTHYSCNDQVIEGMAVKKDKVFAVQYHPEASPGPHDSHYLFRQFLDRIEHA